MATPRLNYQYDETCECGACPICLELESYLDDKREDERWNAIFAKKAVQDDPRYYPVTPLSLLVA